MKKILSVFLAALMLLAVFAVPMAVFANESVTTSEICPFCGNPHTSYKDGQVELSSCTCCLDCDFLDETQLTKCARDAEGHSIGSTGELCCKACTGFFPCNCRDIDQECECEYCAKKTQSNEPETVEVVSDKAKNTFSRVMQNVLGKLSTVFTKLFEILFAVFNVND